MFTFKFLNDIILNYVFFDITLPNHYSNDLKNEGEVSENGHYLCLLPLIISPEQTTKMIWKDKGVSKVHFVLLVF